MLSIEQKEILTGLMLGDGHLELHKNGKNASLRITRKSEDESYIDYHVNIFSNLGAKRSDGQVKDKRTNKIYLRTMLHTSVHSILTQWHKVWYRRGKKIIPKNLKLTPLTLATWFADDGSLTIKKRQYNAKLATHGFTKQEVILLKKQLLSQLNLCFKIYRDNSGKKPHWFLMLTNKNDVRQLINIINTVFPKGMTRKSDIWNNSMALIAPKIYPPCKYCYSIYTCKNGTNQQGKAKYMCKNCKKQFIITC